MIASVRFKIPWITLCWHLPPAIMTAGYSRSSGRCPFASAIVDRDWQIYISTGWTEAADIHQAQDLFAALSQQHEACAESLALKDSLLAAMKGALTAKEGKYVQTVGMHGKVICTPCLLITITHFTQQSCIIPVCSAWICNPLL